jgi:hypothetical protein
VGIRPEFSEFFVFEDRLSSGEFSFMCKGASPEVLHETLFREGMYPALGVLPMGFSWSFYFVQALHEQKLISSGLDPSRFLVSSWPAPPVGDSCIALPYCDNLTIFGKCPDTVNQCLEHVMSSFSEIRFELHEIEYATPFTTTLGAQLDGSRHMVRPRPERVWALCEAFRWAASGIRISGQQLEVLLGHFVHEALFPWPALSVFHACYSFIRDSYDTQSKAVEVSLP